MSRVVATFDERSIARRLSMLPAGRVVRPMEAANLVPTTLTATKHCHYTTSTVSGFRSNESISIDTSITFRSLWDQLPTLRSDSTSISSNSFSTQARRIGTNSFAIGGFGRRSGGGGSTRPTRSRKTFGIRRRRLPFLHKHNLQSVGNLEEPFFPLSAIHVAQTIDLFPLLSTVFTRNSVRKQLFGKNSIVIELPPVTEQDPPRYVAVFRFGSVVCLNVSPREISQLVREIKNYAKDPVPAGLERKESFGVLVKPDMLEYDEESGAFKPIVTGDYCVVPELTLNGVAVISNILGQTVALDTYNDTVENLLANFASINSTVAKTGKFTSTDKGFLFKTVAQNNSIFIDMISKIRIKDRSETAWSITKYETIHYGLKAEFELDERFDQIEFKLSLIQEQAKFFLDVLQSQKSNSLEWIIVILISVECVLSCVDMSGNGEAVFATISKAFGGG